SADSYFVASASDDGKVHLTDTATGKELGTIPTSKDGALRLGVSPDGKTLAVGGPTNPTVWLYDIGTGKETKVLKPPSENDETLRKGKGLVVPFRSAPPPLFSPDGRLLAAPARGALEIWDVITGRHLRRFALPANHALRSAAFTPDGRSLALDIE